MSKLDTIKTEALVAAQSWLRAHNDDSPDCPGPTPIDCQREHIVAAIDDAVPVGIELFFIAVDEEHDLAYESVPLSRLSNLPGGVSPEGVLRLVVIDDVTGYVFDQLADDPKGDPG